MPIKKTLRGKYPRKPRHRPQDAVIKPSTETDRQLREYHGRLATENDEITRRIIITRIVKLLYDFEARPEQIDCILWILYEKKDLILVAKTSFGKSLIMQTLPCLVPRSIILIVLPLLALGFEQEEKI
jgi:superfamily II DNA helicase RecQ